MEPDQNATAAGATVQAGTVTAAAQPADLAEAGTRLPRRGRTKNGRGGEMIHISVDDCRQEVRPSADRTLDAGELAVLLGEALENITPLRTCWVLSVTVGHLQSAVVLPHGDYTRDQAVEVAWRRIAIVAQRGKMPQQEG
jgi:hypothetical protein